MIDLSYPISSGEEIAVITMLSNNVQYELVKPCTIVGSLSLDNVKMIPSKTYAGGELLSVLEGIVEFNHFVNDE